MNTLHVDIAVIGAGSAGMGAYRGASHHTDDVRLIDPGPYGTTCVRVGCMPSKLLIAAADAAHEVGAANGFGVIAAPPRIDGMAVMAGVRAERDRFVGFVLESVDSWPAERRLQQRARFIAPSRLLKYLRKQVFRSLIARPWMAAPAKQARKRLIRREPVRACTGLAT
jgi:dihydrolipoamide dehydrogenase